MFNIDITFLHCGNPDRIMNSKLNIDRAVKGGIALADLTCAHATIDLTAVYELQSGYWYMEPWRGTSIAQQLHILKYSIEVRLLRLDISAIRKQFSRSSFVIDIREDGERCGHYTYEDDSEHLRLFNSLYCDCAQDFLMIEDQEPELA